MFGNNKGFYGSDLKHEPRASIYINSATMYGRDHSLTSQIVDARPYEAICPKNHLLNVSLLVGMMPRVNPFIKKYIGVKLVQNDQ